jgi:cystathionine gamma-synthase
MNNKWRPETLAATALGREDESTGAITPPLHPSTTYLRDPDNLYRRGRTYGRPDNATFDSAARTLTALEGARRRFYLRPAWRPPPACSWR